MKNTLKIGKKILKLVAIKPTEQGGALGTYIEVKPRKKKK